MNVYISSFNPTTTYEEGPMVNPISQRKKLRLSEAKGLPEARQLLTREELTSRGRTCNPLVFLPYCNMAPSI